MKKTLLNSVKIVIFAIIMILATGLKDYEVYGADANVTVSSTSVEEGKDVSVSVTISSAEKMAAYNIMLTYDANLLEYVSGADGGGNGAVKLLNELFEDTSVTRTLTFKTKKAGSVSINVDASASSIINMSIEDCNLVAKNGTVTVNPKVTSSSNNYLSSLVVAGVREDGTTAAYNITQRETNVVGFDKNQDKYMAYVANDIVKFAVTAVAEDNTATVSVTGVDLAEGGANVTTITVTAQNGEVRTYVINTYRVPSEGEDETTTMNEETSEPESETTSTPEAPVDKEVTIGDDIYVVTNISEETLLPEGFSRIDYTYDGQNYVVARGEAKKLTIMELVKKGTDEKALYVYDEVNNVFYKFVNIQIIDKMYTVTEKPEEVAIPADFEATLVNIDGEMLNVWANKNEEGIYMFYGMNWNGEEGLYLYDSKEKTAMRYLALTSFEVSNTVTPEPDNSTGSTSSDDNATVESEDSTKIIIIIAEACLILVLIIVIIILIIKAKNPDLDDEDEDFDDEDESELDDDVLPDDELAELDADVQEEEAYEEEVREEVCEEETFDEEVQEEVKEEEVQEEEAYEEEVYEEEAGVSETSEEIYVSETASLASTIEEMLSDSSTSLNDDELDMVLDKLLSDD